MVVEQCPVQPLAEGAVLQQYLQILAELCSHALRLPVDVGGLGQDDHTVQVVGQVGRRIDERIVFVDVHEGEPRFETVEVVREFCPCGVRAFAAELGGEFLDLLRECRAVVEDLRRRGNFHMCHGVGAPLGLGVEKAQGIDLIAP